DPGLQTVQVPEGSLLSQGQTGLKAGITVPVPIAVQPNLVPLSPGPLQKGIFRPGGIGKGMNPMGAQQTGVLLGKPKKCPGPAYVRPLGPGPKSLLPRNSHGSRGGRSAKRSGPRTWATVPGRPLGIPALPVFRPKWIGAVPTCPP